MVPDIKIVENESPDAAHNRKKSSTQKALHKTYDIKIRESAEYSEEEDKPNNSMI